MDILSVIHTPPKVINSQLTPHAQAMALQEYISQAVVALDAATTRKDNAGASNLLYGIQSYIRQTLLLFPQLSTDQKAALAKVCSQQSANIRTDLFVLPESSQMDGELALAGCQAMQEAVL